MHKIIETAVPYGYKIVDGKVVVNEIESEFEKWLFAVYEEYHKNPPACLVEDVIRRHFEEYGESRLYEEAKREVSRSAIERYLEAESRGKWRLYQAAKESITKDQMKEILALPYSEVELRLEQLPKKTDDARRWNGINICAADTHFEGKKHCEPIISVEHFEQVQEILKSKRP